MTALPAGDGRPGTARPGDGAGQVPVGRPAEAAGGSAGRKAGPVFDRHLVLDSLGGWRGMLDATLPTVAFLVGNSAAGLRAGIAAALGTAVLLFALRLARRESVQQAFSGLIGVGVAVAIAAASGQARDFFVPGLIRNGALAAVLIGSVVVRRPLVGVVAEFLAPSHLGSMAAHSLGRQSLPGLRRRGGRTGARAPGPAPAGTPAADPAPERHWREDARMVRAYSWLTLLWAAAFLVRLVVQWVLYRADEVELLGTASLVLGLPVTAVVVVVTLVVVARLHRHRADLPA